jgi:hypothetical protein
MNSPTRSGIKQTTEIRDAILWVTLFELVEDGNLGRQDQQLICQEFGESVLE